MKLLHVDASITGEGSVSRQVSKAIVETLGKANPGLTVAYRDLAAAPLGDLSAANIPAAHPLSNAAPGDNPGRTASEAALQEFLDAEIVVIGAPMYNFTIPSQLKAWLDRLAVPGRTFKYSEAGPEGLAKGKRVIIALARGNAYGAHNTAFEHAESWLKAFFNFIGVEPEFVIAEGIAWGPDHRAKALEGALTAAEKISVEKIAA
jgi:FMN-dependent NADH-azoreductase